MAFTLNMADILTDMRPGEKWAIRGDHLDYANLEWLDGAAKPTEGEMTTAELAAAKAKMTAAVKIEAQSRILTAVPQWRQNNMGAGKYTEGTTPTLSSLNTLIDNIRTDSDTAETDIAALGTTAAVIAFTW